VAAPPYIPTQTSGLDTWSQNFATLISAAPATYGLTPTDATTIQAVVDAYHAAYLLAGTTAPPHPVPVSPSTRNPVTVAAMRSQMGATVGTIRTYAQMIVRDPGVSNSDKVALGLNLPNTTPSPVPAPASYPLLSLLSAVHLQHQFSYKDSLTPVGKRKAFGAVQLQLVGALGTAPAVDQDALPPVLASNQLGGPAAPTKSPFIVSWAPGSTGKIASYAARWMTRSGLAGPWSPILSTLVT
jgi:hypothetical protein